MKKEIWHPRNITSYIKEMLGNLQSMEILKPIYRSIVRDKVFLVEKLRKKLFTLKLKLKGQT